ncbi:rRNA maturation RNase YbeY [Bombella mellum]|uniref:Endoribonuclease YbeY n=1 Tax=Bombella mellum TaxID=2039288 RepID=A0ABR5ZS80_9PROT|nr:rRNA maturation RNase YbeY [Bombella mellum]MBA5727092.1 rRNA maturation RNase YbeY [Bombella mellum]
MKRPTVPHAEVLISDPRWRAALGNVPQLVQRACGMAQRHGHVFSAGVPGPSFVFADDRHVQHLNARFRGKNKPTNVLTFEPPSPMLGGDIILAYQTVQREARQARKTLKAHTVHLIVHGLLHLAGHDHHHPGEARRMEGLETFILRRMGFGDPWKPRPHSHI